MVPILMTDLLKNIGC